ncbi:hypothetical protein EVAR_43163_1 [Eumeta japonica]|uniref:Uncharacterized protein n=1 Tax=Eumeta variegata TaxID=151549 RepID=A0A4C1XKF3_EUMVA|nr:hypothetical protein EVAR_43163_1 [Eumeta japonica]
MPRSRPTFKRTSRAPVALPRDLENFPALASSKETTPVVNFRPAPAPSSTRGRNQPPRAVLEPPRELAHRTPHRVRGSFIVWRRYPNGDGRSPRGFELGDRRVRRSAPSVPQR